MPVPLVKHEEIRRRFLARLNTGEWPPGGRLPGGRELARDAGCTPVTMERVLRDLVAEGFLRRVERVGTFVASREGWGTAGDSRPGRRQAGILAVFAEECLRAAEVELSRRGWGAVVRYAPVGDLAACLRAVEELAAQGVSGLIWSPLSTPDYRADNRRLAETILRTGLPAVAVDRYPEEVEVNSVVSDNVQGGYVLTRHLLELGHRRIGLVRHRYGSTPEDRHRGYLRALAEAGIAPDPGLVLSVPHEMPPVELVQRLRRWLLAARPTAVWSITGDPLGAAILAAAQAAGLRVPHDLSFATFDNAMAPVAVTRVIQPLAEIGRRAAVLLCDEMARPSAETRRIVLRCSFEKGDSCCRPNVPNDPVNHGQAETPAPTEPPR